jgi:hypothetical protein
LSAAGLSGRHIDIATGVFKQFDRSKTDGRTKQVDQAGYE